MVTPARSAPRQEGSRSATRVSSDSRPSRTARIASVVVAMTFVSDARSKIVPSFVRPRARVVAQAAEGLTPDRSVGASDFDDGRRIRAGVETRGDDGARRAHARGVGGKRRVAGHRLAQ